MNTLVAELSASDLAMLIVAANAWTIFALYILRQGFHASDEGWISAKRSCYMMAGAMLVMPFIGAIFIMASMPNAQDDPTAFKAKMDSVPERIPEQIDEKTDLHSRQLGKSSPTGIEQDETSKLGGLPTGFSERRTLNGKTYLKDNSGNWFEE